MSKYPNSNLSSNGSQPIVDIPSTNIDLVAKVIKRSQLINVYIVDSVMYGIISNLINESFILIRSDISSMLGENVNLSFALSKGNLRTLENLKSNQKAKIFDSPPRHYLFDDGVSKCFIRKINPQNIQEILPQNKTGIGVKTDKCKQIRKAKGKKGTVDFYIYGNKISLANIPNSEVCIALESYSSSELMRQKPVLKLRSKMFLQLISNEVALEIWSTANIYWLKTVIYITDNITIEQFEPLKQIR